MSLDQLDISHGIGFSCRRCGGCCRGRAVPLIPGEKERLESLMTGSASPGLAGKTLFVPIAATGLSTEPLFRLGQDRGSCVFLGEDNSCLIHNRYGYEAKPLACRRYPFEFVQEPHSIVVSASFACRSVVDGTGATLRSQEVEIRAVLDELMSTPEGKLMVGRDGVFRVPDRIVLTAEIGLDWYSYQALERAVIEILEDEAHTLSVRLLAIHALVSAAVAQYGRGFKTVASFATWMERMNSGYGQRWLFQEAASGKAGRGRGQSAVLATLVPAVEDRHAAGLGARNGSGGLRGAMTLARGSGRFYLSSVDAQVELAVASRVAFDQDSPQLRPLLVRYLGEFIRRKGLLRYPSVLKGTLHLLVHFALLRWYAVTLAALCGRDSVGTAELQEAIRVVESCYVQGDALPRVLAENPRLAFLVALLLNFASSPADLVHNPYQLSANAGTGTTHSTGGQTG